MREVVAHFRLAEIWWVQFGKNIATEVTGKGSDFLRPAVIIQLVFNNACLVVPLSTKIKVGDYYFAFCDTKGMSQCANLAQIRYVDGKRLKYKQSSIPKDAFENLREALCRLIRKNPAQERGGPQRANFCSNSTE
ncbi:type II toxin-antitoxin system PemK/MazF family toxin [Candidatus Gracilibacteria bacterium]|nr:type II toxin-antitoxin system PemK/MazF family toxin [Candidatus Gracilibacteria bacterium]